MRRMMKNTDIEYVGKLQKGTKVYIYPPVIGEDGFYILYNAKLTAEYWNSEAEEGEGKVGESEVNFESHTLDGYLQYSSPLLDENNLSLDLDVYINTSFPETINTYQDLANWIGENLSQFDLAIESLNFDGVNKESLYITDGDVSFDENNQIYFPNGIKEINGGDIFVSIPDMLVQNITGYEDEEINIQSAVKIDDFYGGLKVNKISPVRGSHVDIDQLNTSKFSIKEIAGNGTLKIINSPYSVTGILIQNLPTSDPGVKDSIWNDNGTLKISAGQ